MAGASASLLYLPAAAEGSKGLQGKEGGGVLLVPDGHVPFGWALGLFMD